MCFQIKFVYMHFAISETRLRRDMQNDYCREGKHQFNFNPKPIITPYLLYEVIIALYLIIINTDASLHGMSACRCVLSTCWSRTESEMEI
jgi:hypothetical protein